MQPRFALRSPLGVTEDGLVRAKDDVRDDLLESRVVLDLRPWPVFHQLGYEQRGEITLGVRRETLETAEAISSALGTTRTRSSTFSLIIGLAQIGCGTQAIHHARQVRDRGMAQ